MLEKVGGQVYIGVQDSHTSQSIRSIVLTSLTTVGEKIQLWKMG